VAVNRVDLPGGDYTMDHSAVIFLVTAAGIVALFTPPFEVPALVADLHRAAPYLASAPGRHPT
jgi:cytochrome oxidase Cu insertion factor (SCO1/SenC/PrrC family)